MSLVNVAYVPLLTWAHPTLESLEEQALVPMLGHEPIELGLDGHEQEFLDAARRDTTYRKLFAQAFLDENPYTLQNATRAIAAFERTIISMRSPYDRYRFGGDMSAISDSAKRGEILFSSSERAGCFQCHGGWNFAAVRSVGSREAGRHGWQLLQHRRVDVRAAQSRHFERTQRAGDVGKFRPPTPGTSR
jgi:cytochrome c peroxidase